MARIPYRQTKHDSENRRTEMFKKKPEKPKPLSVQIKEAEQRAKLDEIERAARFEREKEERERNAIRAAWRTEDETAQKRLNTEKMRAFMALTVPFAPLVLVNLAAITGQVGWAYNHLEIGDTGSILRLIVAGLFGMTAESIALFLQFYANRALRNRDSAASLYLSAFLVAGLVASLNYSHWSNPADGEFFGSPNATAISFALCSFISPWLWRIKDRAAHREELKNAGEIDARAVKLSMSRKIMHPLRSFMVIWYASWDGVTNPAEAVANYEKKRDEKKALKAEKKALKAAKKAAIKAQKSSKSDEEPKPVVESGKSVSKPEKPSESRTDLRRDARYVRGVKIYRKSLEGPGRPLSQRDLANALGMKNRVLAAQIIKDVKEGNVQGEHDALSQTPSEI
jgi:hypothetical protein